MKLRLCGYSRYYCWGSSGSYEILRCPHLTFQQAVFAQSSFADRGPFQWCGPLSPCKQAVFFFDHREQLDAGVAPHLQVCRYVRTQSPCGSAHNRKAQEYKLRPHPWNRMVFLANRLQHSMIRFDKSVRGIKNSWCCKVPFVHVNPPMIEALMLEYLLLY